IRKLESPVSLGFQLSLLSYEEATDGVSFAVFRKRASQRGRLSEKDKTEMFTAKHLKNDQWEKGNPRYIFHKTCTKKNVFLCVKRQLFF
ncbi:MAG: hypothetical protein ACLSAX_09995, partial [Anaerotignum sp.]|uniref:hypothetical protein n=1 Tax=Anaerotignum sp. TaxID=2039241 RepID=UPI00399164DE